MTATRKPYEIWLVVDGKHTKIATVGTRDHAVRFIGSAHFPGWAYSQTYGHKQFYKNEALDEYLAFVRDDKKHLVNLAVKLPGDSLATIIGINPIMVPRVVKGITFWQPDYKLTVQYPISKRILHVDHDQVTVIGETSKMLS